MKTRIRVNGYKQTGEGRHTQVVQFFRHESDADVQEDLFETGSSQRRLKEGKNNLQNSRKMHPDQRRTTGQSRLQQTDRTLHLHVQLRQSKTDRDAAQWFVPLMDVSQVVFGTA